MRTIVGPVVARDGGYAFDLWTAEQGLRRGFSYRRVEDAHYARRIELRCHSNDRADPMLACATLDQFVSALRERLAAANV